MTPTTIRATVCGIAAAAVLTAAATPQAQAATDPVSRIYSASQNTCLDVSTTDPAHYFLDTYGAPCNGSTAQTFAFHALAITPANTFEIISRSSGQCLTKYRQGIRQAACSSNTAWTLQRIGTTGQQYNILAPSTVGTAYPECVQVAPKPSGYPGPLFTLTGCSSSAAQVFTLAVAP